MSATSPYTLPALPYAFDALEPHIDAQTMQIHHDKHHAAYVNNLNAAIEKAPELAKKPLDELLSGLAVLDLARRLEEGRRAHGRAGRGPEEIVRRLREVQGTVRRRRHRPLRIRLGLAGQERRQD